MISPLLNRFSSLLTASLIAATILAPHAGAADSSQAIGNVTQVRALQADAEPGNWMLHGRTFSEQFFSPLRLIDQESVKRLGVAWYTDVPSPTGIMSQPLMVDGILYFTGTYSVVYALDAATGKMLWSFMPPNPQMSQRLGTNPTSNWNLGTNRGVAVWEGKVYATVGDCRLIAIDAKSGKELWTTKTCDPAQGYGISGAPRVAAGKVFIGNSASDNYARGYMGAYDANTGKNLWRFYTVPVKVDGKYESDFMALVANTWDESAFQYGGANPWDSITYDPDFNRLYFGTSCSQPLDASQRNPSGGDQLFECSIIAVDADTGKYAWHYSVNPNFWWDYDATMTITLAELTLDGKPRKVLMQAPKNGFFFVIDRETGKFISANNYVKVNWASGFDSHGRPIFADGAKYWQKSGPVMVYPGDVGGHSIQPMSFSPDTGLAYIPTCDFGFTFELPKGTGGVFGGVEMETGFPDDSRSPSAPKVLGRLVAWNPTTQSKAWDFPYPTPCNGGVLSTAGGLVFQADNYGVARAFAAADGKMLWSARLQSAVESAPITYTVHGEQYVLFLTGFAGSGTSIWPSYGTAGPSRAIALKLGGKESIPPFHPALFKKPVVADTASPENVATGEHIYQNMWCTMCHGVSAQNPSPNGRYPDLRQISQYTYDHWQEIVRGGSLTEAGMSSFGDFLDEQQSLAIRDYVVHKGWVEYQDQEARRKRAAK